MQISQDIPSLSQDWARNVHILAGQQKAKYYALDANNEGKLIGITKISNSASFLKSIFTLDILSHNVLPQQRVISAIDKTLDAVNDHLMELNQYIVEHPSMSLEDVKLCGNQLFIYPKRSQYSVEKVRKESIIRLGLVKEYQHESYPKIVDDVNVSEDIIQAKKQNIIENFISVFTNLSKQPYFDKGDEENIKIQTLIDRTAHF